MAETVLTEKAQGLAQELAEHERMPVPEIVERALEHYRRRVKAADEPMADFLARLQENAVDIDLEAIIKEGRTASRRDRDIEF
mgnify:CR=1 FL=1